MGKLDNVKKYKAKLKILFYGENLNRYVEYKNINKLQNYFDLIIGLFTNRFK